MTTIQHIRSSLAPPTNSPTTTARNVIFEGYTCLCLCFYSFAFVELVRGSVFFAAVPNIEVSGCVFWSFVPVYTACVFVELISGPVCCLHRRISIWTGVGENLSPVSHLCLF